MQQQRANSAIELTFLPHALQRLRLKKPSLQDLGAKAATNWAAGIVGGLFVITRVLPLPIDIPFLAFLVVGGTAIAAASHLDQKRLKKLEAEQSKIARENQPLITMLLQSISNRKIRRQFDGRSAQILEGAAYHYERIFTILDQPHWRNAAPESPWYSLGRQASEAAHQAMHELLAYHRMAFGDPKHGSAMGSTFDTLEHELLSLEGELGAIMGKMRTTGIRWSRHAYQHPHFDQVFAPSMELAQSLQILADELDRKTQNSMQSPRTAPEAVHRLVHEFRALEVAERELDDADSRAWLKEEVSSQAHRPEEPPEQVQQKH